MLLIKYSPVRFSFHLFLPFDHLMCHPMSRTALKSIYAALDIKGIPKVMGNLWLKLVFEKKKKG